MQQFLIDGLEPQPVSLPGAAGKASEELRESGTFDDVRAGGWDLKARLADQDVDGIDAEVLYPSISMSLTRVPDAEYQLALRARLQRLAGRALRRSAGTDRGHALLSTVDVGAAVAEVQRARRARVARGAPPRPPARGPLRRGPLRPVVGGVRERSLPVSFHIALTGDPAATRCSARGSA